MASATRDYIALRHRIELEVRQKRIAVVAALETAERVRNGIVPAAQQIAQLADGSHESGEVALLPKLEPLRLLNDALAAEAHSIATVRKTVAELERSIGPKIEPTTVAKTPSAGLHYDRAKISRVDILPASFLATLWPLIVPPSRRNLLYRGIVD